MTSPEGNLGHEALAGLLRPGNAGANTAADHIAVLVDALDQLPEAVREDEGTTILVRADAAGCTHDFLDAVVQIGCAFSLRMAIDERAREAILALPERAWASGRRIRLPLPRRRPWAADLPAAFGRLGAIPAPGSRPPGRREVEDRRRERSRLPANGLRAAPPRVAGPPGGCCRGHDCRARRPSRTCVMSGR